ncbi:MAG: class I adenylate cyclase [Thiohalomonadaceae bacterium]
MSSDSTATQNEHDIDFKAVRHRFLKLNHARLERARDALRERQRDVLDVLPLLFHINHAMLPGFVSKDTPAGLSGHEPSRRELEVGKRLARSFEYKRLRQRHFPILALYMIGSPGSIAYSEESDFDIWVCHDPALSVAELALLQQKASAIEAWAATLDLEVHFYLVNVDRFRSGEVLPLSEESSGSAQHNLLLEEFYRTAILIVGQAPLWWLVPPSREGEYDDYVRELQEKRFLHARDHLNFGGLTHVPAEEFFGAALWHIYKGIDSPYKAALKLLLIESYANEYPHIDLLSLRFKQALYRGEDNVSRLDPYLMMLEKVEEYLQRQNDKPRLELARRAFYFKAGERLSEEQRDDTWQRELLLSLARNWGWRQTDLMLLDSRNTWKVQQVAEERRTLFDALTTSYRFLSDFARRYAGMSLITQRDLTVLGRKLYAAFERKAGKVELLNRGINADLREAAVTIEELLDDQRQAGWLLYRGTLTSEEMRLATPLKRARNIIELVAWCYFNGIIDRHTVVALYPRITQLTANELKAIVERMQALFPAGCLDTRSLEEYAGPARIVHSALFVNNELDSFTSLSLGQSISSGRPDALSYGGTGKNLVQSMDLVIVTSWREVLTYHFRRGKGLMDFFCEYFKWAPPSRGEAPPRIQVYGTSAQRGHIAAQRIDKLFHDLVATWYGAKALQGARYVVAVGRGYYLLSFEGDTLQYEALSSASSLYSALGRPSSTFRPVVLDPHTLTDPVLPLIYNRNRAGWVQFFYHPRGEMVEVYVLDERGSLFHETLPFFDARLLLSQFSRFFDAVLNRINFLMQEGQQTSAAEGVEFFLIGRDSENHYRLERQMAEFRNSYQQYLSLQVIVDHDENGATVFTLYCGEREFSTLEHGSELFSAVVRHVLELRRSGQHYPIYITDIGMSRAVLGEQGVSKVQTVHFLNYKRRIENELNRVLLEES